MVLCFFGSTTLLRGWVKAGVYVRVGGWVRDRVGFRVRGRVRGYVRFRGGVRVRVRLQLWIREKNKCTTTVRSSPLWPTNDTPPHIIFRCVLASL